MTLRPSRSMLGGALCGGAYGLALARALFEAQPLALGWLNTWPGAGLALAAGAAVAGLTLHALRARAANPFAVLALLLPALFLFSPEVNTLRSQALLSGAFALFLLLLFNSDDPITRWPNRLTGYSVCLCALLFLIYLRTLAPTVGEADAFEFQVNALRLGVSHGNGYPLLMLLGKAFSLLPLGGTAAWRVNLTAAFFAALAAVGVERVTRRLGARPLPALLAGLAFGLSPSVWARATEIEAYTLHAALLSILVYLGLELIDRRDEAPPRPVYALAFVFGLALTNHLTTLMLAPACLVAGGWWLSQVIRNSPKPLISLLRHSSFILFFLLLGLSIYFYLPVRWPAVNDGASLSLEQFMFFIKGGEANAQLNALLPFEDWSRWGIVLRKLTLEFGLAGFALMLMGLGALALRRGDSAHAPGWRAALFLSLAYLGFAYFTLAYNPPEPDFSDFFIALYLLAAIFIGLGMQTLLNDLQRVVAATSSQSGVSQRLPPASRLLPSASHLLPSASRLLPPASRLLPSASCLLLSVFCLLPLNLFWSNFPRLDLSQKWGNAALGEYTLLQPLAPDAAILADPKHLAPLYYLQVAEGVRRDLDIMVLPDEAAYRAVLDDRLARGQTAYLARYLAGLGSGYSLRSVGPLAEVSPTPFTAQPEMPHLLAVVFPGDIQLAGYHTEWLNAPSSRSLLVTLYWHAARTPEQHLAVYLRLRDAQGTTVWENAGRVPVDGLYPTNAWRPGEYISDFHVIPVAPHLAPGQYQLEAGLFPPFQPAEAGWAAIAPVAVEPPAAPPQPAHELRARFGGAWLLGYDAPESAPPGSSTEVTLYWGRGEGEAVTAFGETRSLAAWPAGAIAPQVYRLTLPRAGARFDLNLHSGEPAQCGWLAPRTEACSLSPITLAGEALVEGAVNFNNQLLLRRATLETPEVTRREQVQVTLEWQGLQAMGESYTVFVHLVGPEGALHGQRDYWPVQGTRLTSSWGPGEVIVDAHQISFFPDAPPGEYSLHIGLYLLETLERVPVLNADGQPVDDKVVLSGLAVR
jgi:hypothetical protein